MLAVYAAEASVKPMEAITTALTTAINSIGTDAMDAIAKVLPVALPVMGAVVVVNIGVRIFKKFAK